MIHDRRRAGLRSGRRAMALIATLVLLAFLGALIAAAMMGNATARAFVRSRQDGMTALCLAESGAQEALRALAAKTDTAASLQRAVGKGAFRVEWRADTAAPATYEVVSVGVARAEDPSSARKRVRVRAEVRPAPGAGEVHVLSWRTE